MFGAAILSNGDCQQRRQNLNGNKVEGLNGDNPWTATTPTAIAPQRQQLVSMNVHAAADLIAEKKIITIMNKISK